MIDLNQINSIFIALNHDCISSVDFTICRASDILRPQTLDLTDRHALDVACREYLKVQF